jgi:DNA repair protein RadC
LTKRLVEAGQIIGIEVLDHLIIGEFGYASLKAKGLF